MKRFTTKLGALACAAALASCAAVPAFAADGTTTTTDKNFTTEDGTTTSDVILEGKVAKEGTLITVTVPSNIPFAITLDDANGYFKGLTSPVATITNSQASNAPVKVSVASVEETTQGENKLLGQMTDLLLKGKVDAAEKSVDMVQFGSLNDNQKVLADSIAAGKAGEISIATSVQASDNKVLKEGDYTVKAVLKIDALTTPAA